MGALIASGLLFVANAHAVDAGKCSSSLITSCPTRAAPWKLLAQPSKPIAKVALVVQDFQHTPGVTMSDILKSTGTQDDGPLRVMTERMAHVMSANGLATQYAGHVARRSDVAGLPGVDADTCVLLLLPKGAIDSFGGVFYLALLYGPGELSDPLFQSDMRLGRGLRAPAQDIAATELVNAFVEAGLSSRADGSVAPVPLFASYGPGI